MRDVRLDRLLANLGYGSRRDVAAMVKAGRVTLDGDVFGPADAKVDLATAARLMIGRHAIDPLPGVVIRLNKPLGVTCSHKETGPLVYECLPERWRRRDPPLSTVGRLDKETSGLLLLTDDGALLHRIISPRAAVSKTYLADLARPLRGDEAAIFAAGTLLLDGEDKPLLAARLEPVGPRQARVTITEGRYHQVRRMFAAVGNHVEALHRESLGALHLPPDLAPGAFDLLDATAIDRVFAAGAG